MTGATISCNGCGSSLEEVSPGDYRCTRPGCGKGRVSMGPGASIKVGPDGNVNIGGRTAASEDPDLPAIRKIMDDAIVFLKGSGNRRIDPANPAHTMALGVMGVVRIMLSSFVGGPITAEELNEMRIVAVDTLSDVRKALG